MAVAAAGTIAVHIAVDVCVGVAIGSRVINNKLKATNNNRLWASSIIEAIPITRVVIYRVLLVLLKLFYTLNRLVIKIHLNSFV